MYHGDVLSRENLSILQDVIVKEPYLSKVLLDILHCDMSISEIYSSCFLKSVDNHSLNPDTLPNLLFIAGQSFSLGESDQKSITKALSISKNKCLLKHITIELGLRQTNEERYRLSNFLKRIIVDELLQSFDVLSETMTHVDEKLCYYLVANNTFPLSHDNQRLSDLGWLIFATNPRGPINILLSVINTLIKTQSTEELCTILKSKSMVLFNQLLLVNLWHPDLANVTTMQVLLDTCYPLRVGISLFIYYCFIIYLVIVYFIFSYLDVIRLINIGPIKTHEFIDRQVSRLSPLVRAWSPY